MSNTWFISDTHWNHANILTFRGKDGNLIRPEFENVHDMNEYMIERWNSVVAEGDKVYHLGDVTMSTSAKAFETLYRLNGRKVLIKGNHDNAKLSRYAEHFQDVRSEIHKKTGSGNKIVFTHRPILFNGPDNDLDLVHFNCHGHIHQNEIDDFRYINLCVEHWDYTPVGWNHIVEIVEQRKRSMSV